MAFSNHPSTILDFARSLLDHQENSSDNERLFFAFLEKKSRKIGIPLNGSFELTPFCNLDCKMCYVHLSEAQMQNNTLLSQDAWISIIDQAHKAGMLKASLTGGECLTYPWFDDIYSHLWNKGIRPSVLTNGLLLDNNRIGFFMKYLPKHLQVTLYGSSDDAYEKVTGHRVFKQVYNNLIAAKNANLPLSIAITPNAYMAEDMHSLLSVAEELRVPYYINSALKPPRKETGRVEEDLSIEQYIELFKIQKALRNDCAEEKHDYFALPAENGFSQPVYGLRCGGGRSGFAVSYNGNVSPCHSLYNISASAVDLGFEKAWKQINQMAASYSIPAECPKCLYRDICLTCPAMHTNAPVAGHCDPRICERTKAMISAGILPLPNDNEVNNT